MPEPEENPAAPAQDATPVVEATPIDPEVRAELERLFALSEEELLMEIGRTAMAMPMDQLAAIFENLDKPA